MKNPTNKVVWLPAVLAGVMLLALTVARAVETSDVLSPTKRQEVLDGAKKLLAPHESPAVAADPFHSEAFNELITGSSGVAPVAGESSPGRPGPRSNRDQLEAIAAGLKPSGFFILGGQPTLVFGQKRVKAGGSVTINFEGTEYNIEVTAIDRTNFTLRLNREEFTRPIK